MDGDLVDDGVRTGEIDVLKDAGGAGCGAAVALVGVDAPLVEHQNLTGLQVANHVGTGSSEGAALGRDNIGAVRRLTVAQGTEAVGVTGRQQLGGGHEHQGEGTLQPVHGLTERVLDGGGFQAFLGDDVGDDLRVAGGVEDGAVQLQLTAQLEGVAQVAVVCQRQLALLVVDLDGLAVVPVVGAGGAVADVPHRHGAVGEVVHDVLGEHVADESQILVGVEESVVTDHDAAALLTTVLEGVEAVIGGAGHRGGLRGVDAKDAALFVKFFHKYLLLNRPFQTLTHRF